MELHQRISYKTPSEIYQKLIRQILVVRVRPKGVVCLQRTQLKYHKRRLEKYEWHTIIYPILNTVKLSLILYPPENRVVLGDIDKHYW